MGESDSGSRLNFVLALRGRRRPEPRRGGFDQEQGDEVT
jgi:hypothetical protein